MSNDNSLIVYNSNLLNQKLRPLLRVGSIGFWKVRAYNFMTFRVQSIA